jgi:RNA polymerase sigma factor (sigma-70 family)
MMKRLTDEQRELASRHYPLARRVIAYLGRRLHGTRWLFDDFEGAALFEYTQLAAAYNPVGGRSFPTYVRTYLPWALTRFYVATAPLGYRKDRKYDRDADVPDVLNHAAAAASVVDDSPEAPVDDEDAFEQLIAGLSDRHRCVLRLWYGRDLSCVEVAKVMGVSRGHASDLHADARAAVRAALEAKEAAGALSPQ